MRVFILNLKISELIFLADEAESTAWLCNAAPLPLRSGREKEGEVKIVIVQLGMGF